MTSPSFSLTKRRRILNRDGGTCFYCDRPLHLDGSNWNQRDADEKNGYCVLDHVLPLSAGGKHGDDNLVASCRSCNSSKGTKSLSDFRVFILSQRHPEIQAALHLRQALTAVPESPWTAILHEAITWFEAQPPELRFPGEIRQAERSA